jgi:hypothetical protein
LAALRSYQEAHNNYFEELEQKVLDFQKHFPDNIDNETRYDDLNAPTEEWPGFQEIAFPEQEELGFAAILCSQSKRLPLQ